MVMVTAVFVWRDAQQLENFRQFISITQGDPNSPFRRLVHDVWARKVNALELGAEQLGDRLRWHPRAGFVAINPGPEQTLQKIGDFVAELGYRLRSLAHLEALRSALRGLGRRDAG